MLQEMGCGLAQLCAVLQHLHMRLLPVRSSRLLALLRRLCADIVTIHAVLRCLLHLDLTHGCSRILLHLFLPFYHYAHKFGRDSVCGA